MNRILRFYKYLPSFGWNPIILTVGNGLFPSIDHELSKTVRKQTIVYKTNGEYSSAGKPKMAPYGFTDKKNKSLYKKIIQILKVNIIPDNRIYWLPFAMRKSKEIFHKHDIDLIFSSSPPQTNHIVSQQIKNKYGIPWICDVRDVWNEQFYVRQSGLRLQPIDWIDKILEKKILSSADELITVSPDYSCKYSKLTKKNVHTIFNGYDADLYDYKTPKDSLSDRIKITYSGSMSYNHRPSGFFQALKTIREIKPEVFNSIDVEFVGDYPGFLNEMIDEYDLKERVTITNYIPYESLIEKLSTSSLLLLNGLEGINHTAIPSKLFDYIGTNVPILAYGLDETASDILYELNAGKNFDFFDVNSESVSFILECINRDFVRRDDREKVKYERKAQTQQLAQIFDDVWSRRHH